MQHAETLDDEPRRHGGYALAIGCLALMLGACGGGGSKEERANSAPLAAVTPFDTGPVDELASFVLDATPSEDPDGDALTFAWQQIDGPAMSFPNGTAQAALDVVAPKVTGAAQATFRVTVDDGRGGTDTEDVEITVNEAPVVVYAASQSDAGVVEVFRRHATDAEPVKLHADAANGATAENLLVSPDRRYVAYLADREGDGGLDLYVARLDGQGEQRLTAGAVPGSLAFSPAWAPDSSRIAFRGTLETFVPGGPPGKVELFTARPDFVGGRTKLSGAMAGAGVFDFRWAPDGTSIAFRGTIEAANVSELFVVPAAGGARIKVSGAIVADGGVGEFEWAPDGERIAVRGDLETDEAYELFVVSPDNAVPRAKVSGDAPVAGGILWEFRWSPDSARLAFFGPLEDPDRSELFTADLTGARTKLSGATPTEDWPLDAQWMDWSPDGARVVFWGAAPDSPNRFELYSAPRDVAGARVNVSGPALANSLVSPFFVWHPDGERIAFVGDLEAAGRFDAYVAAADGSGDRTKLFGGTDGMSEWSVVAPFEPVVWSPAGDRLAFRSDDVFGDGERHLLTVGVDGGAATAVSGAIADGGRVDVYQWLPDGSGLVFSGDLETDGVYELFRADPVGGLPRVKVSGPLAEGGSLTEFVVAGPPLPEPPVDMGEAGHMRR